MLSVSDAKQQDLNVATAITVGKIGIEAIAALKVVLQING